MDATTTRWDISYGQPFKVGKARAEELLETGQARFRKNGELDRRYRTSRFILHYFPRLGTES